jgi:hypothetical protein
VIVLSWTIKAIESRRRVGKEMKKYIEDLKSRHVQPDSTRLFSSIDVDKAIRLLFCSV